MTLTLRKLGTVLLGSLALALSAAAPAAASPDDQATDGTAYSSPLTTLTGSGQGLVWHDTSAAADTLKTAMGGHVGFAAVMASANHPMGLSATCSTAEQTTLPTAPAATTGLCWDTGDATTTSWHPQGLTTSGDADADGAWGSYKVILSGWQSLISGRYNDARVAFIDDTTPSAPKYRWVYLVVPSSAGTDFSAAKAHSGGMVWYGDKLYVTGVGNTSTAIRVFSLSNILQATDSSSAIGQTSSGYAAYGYQYVMPEIGYYSYAGGTCTMMADGTYPSYTVVSAPFFLRGELLEGGEVTHRSRDLGVTFATPRIAMDRAVHPRSEVPPLLNVPLAEIIDFLVETGNRIRDPRNPFVQDCIERMSATHVLPRAVLEAQVTGAASYLDKRLLQTVVEQNFPDPKALDEWIPKQDFTGRKGFVRAFAPRLIHVLPGNSPGVAVKSIAQGALVKAVNLFKMSSSDPFTTVAILATMADIDPGHAIVKSMTALYWRGGDDTVERALYRPQYFDKIVAWGGGDAIDNVVKYLGPGFQLVSFDPKTSISMVGREAFTSDETLDLAAGLAASDVMVLNQEACVASRFIYLEADHADADRFCERLHARMADMAAASGDARPLDLDLREQINTLIMLDDEFRVWGRTDGRGLVIRSDEPVDFHPINKTANVVRVDSLDQAINHVNVATQTVGCYPYERMADYRDRLASRGAQRIVRLGEAGPSTIGNPHDAMYPLHRFVHWMAHEDGTIAP